MRSVTAVGRVAAVGAVIAAVAVVALLLVDAGGGYSVRARFINAGQLVEGNPVQTGGVSIGSVSEIEITDDGQAEITLELDDDHAPLRRGTQATIRQFSLSGIANRYVELRMPPNGAEEIDDGGELGTASTTTAVDLDQLFNTLDPETRESLQGFLKGQARQFARRGIEGNEGLEYLNPALATSSRLFGELTRDTPLLERFLVESSKLVTALAERRDDLAALIGNLGDTTGALGRRRAALAESIERLPPFMRRANTTFVNLRAALDDVDPLVAAAKPVARRLGPFLNGARAFAADAEPAIRDLQLTIRRPGRGNDLIDLMASIPPLYDIARVTRTRVVDAIPGRARRAVNVGRVRGALPEITEAFRGGAPETRIGRFYTTDLMGWFDDFSTTGAGFDALGALARAHTNFSETLPVPRPGPVRRGQFRRCPGAAEGRAFDASNVLSAELRAELRCEEEDRAVGDAQE